MQALFLLVRIVFPAQAGMNRLLLGERGQSAGVPRAGGDEP